jgi:hypothetical protein
MDRLAILTGYVPSYSKYLRLKENSNSFFHRLKMYSITYTMLGFIVISWVISLFYYKGVELKKNFFLFGD